jgi:ectoine hydroxylase-related dioxygenase (phytanoyl-CoA dioxygenase family)
VPAAAASPERVYGLRHLAGRVPSTRALLDVRALASRLPRVLGGTPQLVRALLFDKPRRANWAVPWHQDRTIAVEARADVPGFRAWTVKAGVAHVEPPAALLAALLTVRLQLDDCPDDAPLEVVPGSHHHGILPHAELARVVAEGPRARVVVPRGGALLMRPLLVHASAAARTSPHRRVVHLELCARALPAPLRWHTT